jgi:probable phosphoglycerate mutase
VTTLWLIRHGEAHVNRPAADGSYSLFDEHGLTERGVEQARLLRDRLVREALSPDTVIASSFPRALQTAEIVCEALGVDPVVDHDVQEWRPGDDRETLPLADALASWQRIIDGHDHDLRVTPSAETHNEFLTRVDRALLRIADEQADRTCLVFTHGGVIDRSFVTFLGLPPRSSLISLRTTHTSITEWRRTQELDEPTWVLGRYNDASHLLGTV